MRCANLVVPHRVASRYETYEDGALHMFLMRRISRDGNRFCADQNCSVSDKIGRFGAKLPSGDVHTFSIRGTLQSHTITKCRDGSSETCRGRTTASRSIRVRNGRTSRHLHGPMSLLRRFSSGELHSAPVANFSTKDPKTWGGRCALIAICSFTRTLWSLV